MKLLQTWTAETAPKRSVRIYVNVNQIVSVTKHDNIFFVYMSDAPDSYYTVSPKSPLGQYLTDQTKNESN